MSSSISSEKKRRPNDTSSIVSPLLSVPEAIEYLKVSQSTLYLLMKRLEVVKLNRRVFVTRRSADAFIDANTHLPAKSPRRQRRDERARATP